MNILDDLTEALRMASELSFFTAFPIYLIGYGLAGYCVVALIARIRKLIKEW